MPSSRDFEKEFKDMTARRVELASKKRLTEAEKVELDGIEATLEAYPSAAIYKKRTEEDLQSLKDVAHGKGVPLEQFIADHDRRMGRRS